MNEITTIRLEIEIFVRHYSFNEKTDAEIKQMEYFQKRLRKKINALKGLMENEEFVKIVNDISDEFNEVTEILAFAKDKKRRRYA